MPDKKEIKLSPSALSIFLDCPRCFWLRYHKRIKRPRGYFPTLLMKMDKEVKVYFNRFRGDLPSELKGKVMGKLMTDMNLLEQWRDTRWPGLIYYIEPKIRLAGSIDDCLILNKTNGQRYYLPIDFKSRGSGIDRNPIPRYYQNQLDIYALLLEKNGYPQNGIGYLIYYILKKIDTYASAKFDVRVVEVELNVQRAMETVHQAIEVIKGPLPPFNQKCEYCRYREN